MRDIFVPYCNLCTNGLQTYMMTLSCQFSRLDRYYGSLLILRNVYHAVYLALCRFSLSAGHQWPSTAFAFDVAIDAPWFPRTNSLAGFSAGTWARAMISTHFGGNALLLSAVRRVGNAAECDVWRDISTEFGRQTSSTKFWTSDRSAKANSDWNFKIPLSRYRSWIYRCYVSVGVAM